VDAPIDFVNGGLAEFQFGPNVIFSQSGDQLGSFRGSVTVTSKLTRTGKEKSSDPYPVDVRVLPSVLITELRSVDENCPSYTTATTMSQNLAVSVRAIGLGGNGGTRYRIGFISPAVTVTVIPTDESIFSPSSRGSPPEGPFMMDVQGGADGVTLNP